ncbi:hypothetical protein [Flavobacterium sp.]|jgi:hypothetical protein|uniref:hypothetical protein n=1 Tax=Flavobacterium sp. TaxID=239 RepID=UPI0037C0C2A8
MRKPDNNPHPNRLLFPIDFLTTIKSIGVEEIKNLREFIINQTVLHLDSEFMDDPEIRAEWQNAINTCNDLCVAIEKHQNINHDDDVVETIKFLEDKRIELIAEMEVDHG